MKAFIILAVALVLAEAAVNPDYIYGHEFPDDPFCVLHGIEMKHVVRCSPVPEIEKWSRIRFSEDKGVAMLVYYSNSKCSTGEVLQATFKWGVCVSDPSNNSSSFWTWTRY